MPTWPLSLPRQPISGTLSISLESNVGEFAPDFGSPLRRRRYTATRKFYQGEMSLTSQQVDAMQAFFSTDCADGVKSFTMRDWKGDFSATFSWVSPPSFTRVAVDYWRASLSLAKEP